jgi:ribosomal protein S18 acetylase RimI-like enzyme
LFLLIRVYSSSFVAQYDFGILPATVMDWPPNVLGPGTRRGNILNVYTSPEYRRRGIGRALVAATIDAARHCGISCVILHATAEGRLLYDSMGFRASNEMRIFL